MKEEEKIRVSDEASSEVIRSSPLLCRVGRQHQNAMSAFSECSKPPRRTSPAYSFFRSRPKLTTNEYIGIGY